MSYKVLIITCIEILMTPLRKLLFHSEGWRRAFKTRVDQLRDREAQLTARTAALEAEVVERKRVERELRQKSSELQAIFQALPEEIALRQAHSHLQQRNNLLAQILELGNSLHRNLNLETLLQELVQAVRSGLGFDVVVLNLVDKDRKEIRVWAHAGLNEEARRLLEGASYTWEDFANLLQERFQVGQCYFIPHNEIDWDRDFQGPIYRLTNDDLGENGQNNRWHVDDALFVPIQLRQDQIVGIISVDGPVDGQRPSPETLKALEIFANQAATAIENARLYKQAQEEIIERRKAEEALKIYAAKLEQSNQELEQFAYVASHDLQEPLRKIQTFGDRLKTRYSETLGGQGRDYLDRMQHAAARMQTLIQDLLIYSRVTTQAQPFAPVNLAEVVQGVLSDLETYLEKVGGRVEVEELPTIEADPTQMRRLLQNLIGNSLKFHLQDEAPFVKIRTESLENRPNCFETVTSPLEFCQILVEDNGIGFEEKYLDRIFQMFQRLHGRSSKYEGTGIGLATCRKIVERHGGCITARSVSGQGATFVVTLPLRQSSEATTKLGLTHFGN